MTKHEFLIHIPDTINHRTWGYSELEIVVNKDKRIWACYRDKENGASCGTSGVSWKELYEKLSSHLIKEGYMVKLSYSQF